MLQPGRTFIDVGANISYFSLLAAKHYAGASIISLEPFAVTYRAFLENFVLNGFKNIEALNLVTGGK